MKKLQTLFSIIITFVLFSCSGDLDSQADKLQSEGKFDEAFEVYKKSAEAGSSYAKWNLARLYDEGLGVKFNSDKAKELLIDAANSGSDEAKCDYASALLYGWFKFDKDKEKGKSILDSLFEKSNNTYVQCRYARELLEGGTYEEDKKEAERILSNINDKDSKWYLRTMGLLYTVGGYKISQDEDEAIKYYKKAFEKGHAYSAALLCSIYNNNNNNALALEWVKKGALLEDATCLKGLSYVYRSNDSIYSEYHDINKSIDILKKLSNRGDADACRELGDIYYVGEIVNTDYDKAFTYYAKAYELKDAKGAFAYGMMYVDGLGCDRDIKKGIDIWENAVKYGSGGAANNLHVLYKTGNFYGYKTDIDINKAKKYLEESAKLGDYVGCYNIALMYYDGDEFFEKNEKKAFLYMKKSADQNYVNACSWMATFYEKGIGTDKNPEMAKFYKDKTVAKDK